MSVLNQGGAFTRGLLGTAVRRPTATLPQTATGTLFTVAGGRVLVTAIVGEVTTILGAVGNLNLVHDPDGAGAVGDVCAATACGTDAVGTLYSITGVAADLLGAQKVTGTEVPTHVFTSVFAGAAKGLVLPAGALGLKTSASSTGSIKWDLFYVPIDEGASVVAA